MGGGGGSVPVCPSDWVLRIWHAYKQTKRRNKLLSCKTNGCLGKSKNGRGTKSLSLCHVTDQSKQIQQTKAKKETPVEGSNVRIRKFVVLNFWPKSKDGFHSSFQVPAPTNFQRRTPIPLFPGHTYRLTVFQLIGGVQQG